MEVCSSRGLHLGAGTEVNTDVITNALTPVVDPSLPVSDAALFMRTDYSTGVQRGSRRTVYKTTTPTGNVRTTSVVEYDDPEVDNEWDGHFFSVFRVPVPPEKRRGAPLPFEPTIANASIRMLNNFLMSHACIPGLTPVDFDRNAPVAQLKTIEAMWSEFDHLDPYMREIFEATFELTDLLEHSFGRWRFVDTQRFECVLYTMVLLLRLRGFRIQVDNLPVFDLHPDRYFRWMRGFADVDASAGANTGADTAVTLGYSAEYTAIVLQYRDTVLWTQIVFTGRAVPLSKVALVRTPTRQSYLYLPAYYLPPRGPKSASYLTTSAKQAAVSSKAPVKGCAHTTTVECTAYWNGELHASQDLCCHCTAVYVRPHPHHHGRTYTMVDVKGRFVREVHEDEIIFPENVDFAERAHRANRAHIAQAAGGANADANGKGHADDNKSSKQPPPAPRTGVQMTRTAADGTTRTTTLVDSRDSVERRFHIALDELGMATPHGDLVVYKAAAGYRHAGAKDPRDGRRVASTDKVIVRMIVPRSSRICTEDGVKFRSECVFISGIWSLEELCTGRIERPPTTVSLETLRAHWNINVRVMDSRVHAELMERAEAFVRRVYRREPTVAEQCDDVIRYHVQPLLSDADVASMRAASPYFERTLDRPFYARLPGYSEARTIEHWHRYEQVMSQPTLNFEAYTALEALLREEGKEHGSGVEFRSEQEVRNAIVAILDEKLPPTYDVGARQVRLRALLYDIQRHDGIDTPDMLAAAIVAHRQVERQRMQEAADRHNAEVKAREAAIEAAAAEVEARGVRITPKDKALARAGLRDLPTTNRRSDADAEQTAAAEAAEAAFKDVHSSAMTNYFKRNYMYKSQRKEAVSLHDNTYIYRVGEFAYPSNGFLAEFVSCGAGLHWFVLIDRVIEYMNSH